MNMGDQHGNQRNVTVFVVCSDLLTKTILLWTEKLSGWKTSCTAGR